MSYVAQVAFLRTGFVVGTMLRVCSLLVQNCLLESVLTLYYLVGSSFVADISFPTTIAHDFLLLGIAERPEERVRRGDPGGAGTSGAAKEAEVRPTVILQLPLSNQRV